MRRVAPALPVPPDMLRHFAALTIVITAGLAMFAHGEGQNAIAEQIKQRQMQTEALRAQRERATKRTVVIDGLRIAPGTRLSPADVEPQGEMVANVVPMNPQAMADFPEGSAGPVGPASPPDVTGRNANAGPMPPPAMMMRMRGKPGQARTKPGQVTPSNPAPPSEQEVRAMIEASAQRAGKPSGE